MAHKKQIQNEKMMENEIQNIKRRKTNTKIKNVKIKEKSFTRHKNLKNHKN